METRFSKELTNWRKSKGLTQEQLAEKLDIRVNSYSRWETGERQPSLKNMTQLTKIFKIPISTMLDMQKVEVYHCEECGSEIERFTEVKGRKLCLLCTEDRYQEFYREED